MGMLRNLFSSFGQQDPNATAMATPAQPAATGDSSGGFWRGENGLLGNRNLARFGAALRQYGSQNPDVFGAADNAAAEYDKKKNMDTLAAHIKDSPALKDPQSRQLVQDMLKNGMVKEAMDMVKMKAPEPFTLGAGQTRYDATGKQIASAAPKGTTLQENLVGAGFQPGTPEYQEAMNKVLFKSGGSSYAGAQALDRFHDELGKANNLYGYGWDSKQLQMAQDRYLKGYKTMPDGTPLPDLPGTASEAANQALKAGTNSQGLTQTRAANMVDKILTKGQEQIKGAASYAGGTGQGALLVDRIKSGAGKGTKDYQDYIKFTRVTVPAAVNAAIKAEGANMSDDAKKLLINSLNPVSWDNDFESAMGQYNYFQELYGGTISPAAAAGNQEVRSEVKSNEQKYTQPEAPQASPNVGHPSVMSPSQPGNGVPPQVQPVPGMPSADFQLPQGATVAIIKDPSGAVHEIGVENIAVALARAPGTTVIGGK